MKNLIVCSDGTGNRGGKTHGTNVWRLMQAVDRFDSKVQQVSFYDDGVGTEQFKWLKLLGGAFGWGLSRNLCELYRFIALNYDREAGDKLFLFGFSRGAFTVRALAGMITRCGLIEREELLQAHNKKALLNQILDAYRCVDNSEVDELRRGHHFNPIEIECLAVWDTVDAVGCPDELRQQIDPICQHITNRRMYGFSHARELSPNVKHGFQALAIDDERQTFHPNLWKSRDGVEQVWFSGMHSNVGGGYPKDGMALVSLDWMIGKVQKLGVKFLDDKVKEICEQQDVHAKMYDSRSGIGTLYRYKPRELGTMPHIHISVYERIARATELYAPYVIPEDAEPAYSETGPYSKREAKALTCELDGIDKQRVEELVERRIRANQALLVILALVVVVGGYLGYVTDTTDSPASNWVTSLLVFSIAGLPQGVADLLVENWALSLPIGGLLWWLLQRSRDARFKIRDLMLKKWTSELVANKEQDER